ncbi:MAG TPA: hypothetical protein VJQ53_02810, partial [Candidatus Eisenbacteria bacterium]|nr:hypothetical protein [Candidatus Eisenbacteria bacterium]
MPARILIPLTFVAFWSALALTWSLASGATPTGKTAASDSTASDGGFRVRVREEGSTSKIEAARRALEQAKAEARRDRAIARASRVPVPPEPPDQPDQPDHPDIPKHVQFDTSDNDVVRFGEDITIPEDKVIDGNVVAIGG